jgi:hypothetical protein
MSRQEHIPLKQDSGAAPSAVVASLPNAGRSYKNIKQALADLPEIASSIENKTGWKINLAHVGFEVVTARQLQRRCLEDVTRRTGIPSVMPQSFLARSVGDVLLADYHRSVFALYLPSERKIVINEERLRALSQDAFKSTLHHELTHAAQHQRYPRFLEGIDRLAREQRIYGKHGGDYPVQERIERFKSSSEKLQARMSLLEGQAMALQRMYDREAGLRSEIKMGPVEVALGLTSMLLPGGMAKITQYITGQALFERIHALGLKEVNSLFKNPRSVDRLFGRGRQAQKAA